MRTLASVALLIAVPRRRRALKHNAERFMRIIRAMFKCPPAQSASRPARLSLRELFDPPAHPHASLSRCMLPSAPKGAPKKRRAARAASPQGQKPRKNSLCEWGNVLQHAAEKGYDAGLGLQYAGALVAAIGGAVGGLPGTAPGVALLGIGGAVSWASTAPHFIGGAMQYGADPNTASGNLWAGGVSAGTGGVMHGIGGAFMRGGSNYVTRVHNARAELRTGLAGVGWS